jgi:hypothetical protein
MAGRPNPIYEQIRKLGSDWIGEQIVRLGDDSGDQTVETGVPGQYFARQINGKVIRIHNAIGVAPEFDTRVRVVRSRFMPNVWKLVEVLEDYTKPVNAGRIAYHHKQHEETGPDRLTLDRKQIRQLSARAAGGWDVRVYGGAIAGPGGAVLHVANETLDLSAYTVSEGAEYISIEVQPDGDLEVNDTGTPFGAPNIGTDANIPTPIAGNSPIAYVLMYEGQTEIIDANIHPIISLPGAAFPVDHDHFDDTEGDPEDVSTTAAADGASEFASRRDHVHFLDTTGLGGGDEGHAHGLARFNGASGQTTFDLPDLASQVESLMLNGLEEDPAVYTLSGDGSQIVLDTALASDTLVIVHYVLLNL